MICSLFRANGVFYMCEVRENDTRTPESVSLTLVLCGKPGNLLSVQADKKEEKPKYNIVTCLGPIFGNYNKSNWLVEAVEVDHMLGVNLTVFPIYSISPVVDPYMRSFHDDGMIESFSWYHPMLKKVFYCGQRVLLNHCLYRYMYKSKYIIIKDIDEIIVPSDRFQRLDEMLESLSSTKVAEYQIRSAFFPPDKSDNYTGKGNKTLVGLHRPRTLFNTKRRVKPLLYSNRPKYIVHPDRVLELTVHTAETYVSSFKRYEVPTDVALVHHYRPADGSRRRMMKDQRMWRYAEDILNRIHRRHGKVDNMVNT